MVALSPRSFPALGNFLYLSHLCLIVSLPPCLFKSGLLTSLSAFIEVSPCQVLVFCESFSLIWLLTLDWIKHPELLYPCVLLHHSVNPPAQELLTNPCGVHVTTKKNIQARLFPQKCTLRPSISKMCSSLVKPTNYFIPSMMKSYLNTANHPKNATARVKHSGAIFQKLELLFFFFLTQCKRKFEHKPANFGTITSDVRITNVTI